MNGATSSPLPADGVTTVAGVRLPPGYRARPARRLRAPAPPLWLTAPFDHAAAAWSALEGALSGSGLVPLLLSDLVGDPGRPWESGELEPVSPGELAGLDGRALLPRLWADAVPDEEEDADYTAEALDPFSRAFPGLAAATSGAAGPEALAATAASLAGPLRIGLVAAPRPADAVVAMGWNGAVNCHESPVPLAVVLRSWEDRFGATLLHAGFDSLDLLVRRPAASEQEALAVAAEHFAFCPDNVYQGAGSIRDYAAELPGASRWSFWWD